MMLVMDLRGMSQSGWGKLLGVLAVIFLVKGIFLLLDPTPSYFYGDSEAYLAVATLHWIPPDRSFLYGLLIRQVALRWHSLETLIYLQVICSCAASWLLCFALFKNLSTRFWVAAVCGLLCSVEPLQLLMERYVMTEAIANFLFALYFVLILSYIRRGKLWLLLISQPIAVALIGIRISFLPAVLINSLLVPLLSPAAVAFYRSVTVKFRNRELRIHPPSMRTTAVHLVLCLLVTQVLLSEYKHWYGRLKQREPALFYENGAFLISDLATLVTPEDFPAGSRRDAVFKRVTIDRRDIRYRLAHHFSDGGLWHAVQAEYPDPKQANNVALKAAMHALLRNPLGAVAIAFQTYVSYFDTKTMRIELLTDEGADGRLGAEAKTWLRTLYGVQDPQGYRLSLAKSWHLRTFAWYWVILGTLAVSPALLILTRRNCLPSMLVIVAAALLCLEGATLTVDHPTPRYLTTAAWLVLLMFGIAANTVIDRLRQRHSANEKPARVCASIPASPVY